MDFKRVAFVLFVVFLGIVVAQDAYVRRLRNSKVEPRMYTVVLSLDGFRSDYQSIANTPTLDSIQQNGVKSVGLQPVFPSLTFANHYSIATGLYAENHGIVAKNFKDPTINQIYSSSNPETVSDSRYYGGEPIWVTAESQRIKSAVNMWVGCDAQIKGYRPSWWKSYSASEPYTARIDSVIKRLSADYNNRPHLAMCYIEETDKVGHKYGPDSPEMVAAIESVDSLVGYFRQQLSLLSFSDSINFIVLSDHGMAPVSDEHSVDIEPFIKPEWVDTVICSPAIALVYCKKNCSDLLLQSLQNVKGISTCKRADMNPDYHYSGSNRIGDVVVIADSSICLKYKPNRPLPCGMHGYDNTNPLMNGIFYAEGPNFKKRFLAPQLYVTDIYELMCRLLEIAPAHNDGKFERVECVLSGNN